MRPIPAETDKIARQLEAEQIAGEANAETLPALPGTYGLLFRLSKPIRVSIARLGNPELPEGLYVYCGSAKGPGGVRARLGRHLRCEKTIRWHVDHLSLAATEVAGLVVRHDSECELRARIQRGFETLVPVPGFGSSDCRQCPAHLIYLPEF